MSEILRWTTRHTIPTDPNKRSLESVNSTVVGNQLFIICCFGTVYRGETDTIDAYLFDTTTWETFVHNCIVPPTSVYRIESVSIYNGRVYIITMDRAFYQTLYTFDIQSMTFTKICELGKNIRTTEVVIIKNCMYRVVRSGFDESVIKLDLETLETEKILSPYQIGTIFSFNNKLHMMEPLKNYPRVYFFDEQNQSHLLTLNSMRRSSSPQLWVKDILISQNRSEPKNNLLETIDLDENRWISVPIENCFDYSHYYLKSSEMIGTTIYSVFRYSKNIDHPEPGPLKLEVRILELMPPLVDVCLSKLVDELLPEVENEKIEEELQKLPFPLRPKLAKMIELRKKPVLNE